MWLEIIRRTTKLTDRRPDDDVMRATSVE